MFLILKGIQIFFINESDHHKKENNPFHKGIYFKENMNFK